MFDDHFKKRFGKIPFAIYLADYNPLPNGSEVFLHQHKEMELITVTEGFVSFFIHGEAFLLQKGDSLFIPPYALHRVSVPANTKVRYLCICYSVREGLLWHPETVPTILRFLRSTGITNWSKVLCMG